MGWHYYSSILHGITIHEIATVIYFLLGVAVKTPKLTKTPVYIASLATTIFGIVGFVLMTALLNWRMDIAAAPQSVTAMNAFFIPVSTGCFVTYTSTYH